MARICDASFRGKSKIILETWKLSKNKYFDLNCQQVLGKRDFSESLWTKFGPCRKGLKPSEYPTDTEGIMKKVIRDVSDHN